MMLLCFSLSAVFLTFFIVCDGTPRVDPLVTTKIGLIRGLIANDGDYSMFRGIPFGKIDIENPFGPSEPYPAFEEIFEAYDDSVMCPQIEEFDNTVMGNLDCLHLNIYVPGSASSKNLLPVMVWIYGGGFSIGYAGRNIYGPKFLIRHDIVLVTINYRVGPYGFMCLDTTEYPGNEGLKDQRLALRWVKENIESFGGNADEITIFGESAGGSSVDYHIRSGKEKLFNKAIIDSGTAFIPGLKQMHNKLQVLQLAAVLGFETEDISQAMSFISSVDSELLIAAAQEVNWTNRFSINPFVPCVEKSFEDVDTFVSIDPGVQEIAIDMDIKILLGYNSDEMSIWSYYAENPDAITEQLKVEFDFDENMLKEMEGIVKHFYVGDRESYVGDLTDTVNFLSDFIFNYPTQRGIQSFLQNGVNELYHYVFSYDGGRNFVKRNNNHTVGGASHADEMGYVWDVSFYTEDVAPEDQLIIDRMTAMWTNFVKYGDPTPEVTELLPVKWEPITPDSTLQYLDIDLELSLQTRPFNRRLTFWDLFYKTNEKFYRDYGAK